MVCGVSGCVLAPHHGLSAPAVARYWGYLRSANTPLIVRSSLNLWVPVLLLVLAPVGFRSPLRFWKIPPVDLAAHCVPVSIFHQRCARALDLPANLFVSLNKLLFTAIESFSWFPDRFCLCSELLWVCFVRNQLQIGTPPPLQCHAINYLSFYILYTVLYVCLLSIYHITINAIPVCKARTEGKWKYR